VLKGQDIVVLLHLLEASGPAPQRALADDVGLDVATTHRAIHRLTDAGLYDRARGRVRLAQAEEFLVHAVKYVFPPVRGGETRGVRAAWAAAPLAAMLAPTDELPPVWPHPQGDTRGIELTPLHPVVPELALRGGELADRLALVDAIRAGDARIRQLAERELMEGLGARR
jgi:DNA-binding Lrp family transcriptional regulator